MPLFDLSNARRAIDRLRAALTPKRVTLFSLAAMLAFTTAMPNQVMAIWPSDLQLKQPSVLPAQSADTTKTQAIAEVSPGPLDTKRTEDRRIDHEDVSKRTAFTSTYVNKDGTKTMRYSPTQLNFKQGNAWEKIDNSIKAIEKAVPEKSFLDIISNTARQADPPSEFKAKAGNVSIGIRPLLEGLQISAAGKTFTMQPVGARNAVPERKDDRTIIYRDAWPNVDLEYEVRGEMIKEIIVIKNKSAQTTFDFKVSGGKVIKHASREGELAIEGMPAEFSFSSLTLDVNERGVISEQRVTQTPTANGIKVEMDKDWMRSQDANAFPMRIDPSYGSYVTSWWMFKSDGFSCGASNCYANIGTLNDGSGWKHWRTYMSFPYDQLDNKNVLYANVHGWFQPGINGIHDGRTIRMGHASCVCFHGVGTEVGSAYVGTDFDINFTGRLKYLVDVDHYGAVWSFWGEEGAYKSYKPYHNMYIDVIYDSPTPVPAMVEPANGQVTVSTQPTLRVSPVSDPDGAVKYSYIVSTSPGGSGAVINSGWIDATQWTIPDGILQDGTTYYWRVHAQDVHTYTQPISTPERSFKVDLRTGKDSTQAYDTVGPIGIDLATGNATTSASTHTMNALGGSIGLNFDYDSPAKSKKGLIGEYWQVPVNYAFANGAPTTAPNLVRNDQEVNFDWGLGNPSPGVISDDGFYARWKGHFVAPTTGSYTFGASVDDDIAVFVNNQQVFSRACCSGVDYTGATPVSLQAGQVVPLRIEYREANGAAYAKVYVKGAVAEQPIPRDWLRTEVKATPAQYGLTGRYYTDDGTHNFPTDTSDPLRFMMARPDSKLSFNWVLGGPATGLQGDNFMARWTGYVTVPTSGSYTFGAVSDDGIRVKLDNGFMGASQTVLNAWQDQATTVWGSATNLTAGQQVPITVEYFEHGGGASMSLLIRGPGYADQEIPATWLTPKANALPDAWRLGVDVDGNVGYERLRVVGQNVVLEDSTRATHEYIWTGSGYKPPVNEDGQLTRNGDNTYTLLDIDGRTYIFDKEGKLTSLTTPTDDRNPANLKYEYSGDPSRLIKISDGVNSSRYGMLHYKGINEDGNCTVASGFHDAPNGMLCAFKTSDGDITKLHYFAGNLSRIEKPGGELTDYGYDTNVDPTKVIGHIVSIRDSVASDAVAASKRLDNEQVRTELTYDQLGRASTIKAPAPTEGAARMSHSFDYLIGATQMHVIGTTEPHGFSKKIEYDSLLRTTRETDVSNLSTMQEWDSVKDLQLSNTNASGLKSTTIYDDDDKPVENYGPAPAAWYGPDRRPLQSPTDYRSQVPKTTTGYDEGMTGLAVNYHSYGVGSKSLIGAPKRVGTNISTTNTSEISRYFGANPTDLGLTTNWGFSMTGKMRLPTTGNWSFRVFSDNGARVWIDDQLVLDDWTDGAQRSHPTFMYNNTVANSLHRVKIDYYHLAGDANFTLYATPPAPNNIETASVAQYFSPDYNLATSQTAYDALLGDVTTKTTYSNPAYGTVDKTILDPTGLNLQTTATYETPGTAFLRQTSKTLPGGGTTAYQHYGATETRANPCVTGSVAVAQAGLPKGKTEADPDGTGPQASRTSETVYNASGEVVATRYNADPWTCTEYDSRGRVSRTVIPQLSVSQPSRTITNNYAAGGNPLITSTVDSAGTITVENDLLGRTVKYTDVSGNSTTSVYNTQGLVMSRSGPLGSETFVYDQYDRLIDQKLDNIVYAHITYDQYGHVDNVTYPAAGQQKVQYSRDTLGRTNGVSYTVSKGTAAPGPNLLANPSFEQSSGTPAAPTSWTPNSWGTNTASLTYQSTGRTGTKSVKAALTAYTNGDAKWMSTSVAATANTNYTYSDYFKSNVWSSVVARYTHQDNSVTWSYLGGNNASSAWAQGTFNFTTPSTVAKISVVRLIERVGWVQIDDVDIHQTSVPSSTATISDMVTFAVSGDVRSGTENGIAKSYTYDNGGRLTGATIGNNTYAYQFGVSDTSCSSLAGNNPNAGKNGNRTKRIVNGQVTTYCYDGADRLISSSDAGFNNIQYDAHGNTIRLNTTLRAVYDSSDRNRGIEEYTATGNGRAVSYDRDAQDRIVARHASNIVNSQWQANGSTRYGFTGGGDTPDFTLNATGVIQEKYLLLPGDVLITIRPLQTGAAQKTYSLPNIHDDIFAVTNGNGELVSTHITGPFGEVVSGQTNPANTTTGTTFSYVGQHEKITETAFSVQLIQMGARVYVPGLGRFLSVDSIEGGTDNNYVYANDPVNEQDLDGKALPLLLIPLLVQAVRIAAPFIVRTAVQYVVKPAVQYVAKKAAPFLAKKATALAKKIVPVIRSGVSKAIQNVRKAGEYVKSIRNIQIHKAHHSWPNSSGLKGKVWMRHIQINRINAQPTRLPFGPMYKYKNSYNGPKGRILWK